MFQSRFQMTLARIAASAGFAPAGKLSHRNQARRRAAGAILTVSAAWFACGLGAVGTVSAQAPAATETVLHDFSENAPKGAHPEAGLMADPAGNLYGTASLGGAFNLGVVYEIDVTGHVTVLYSFAGVTDGFQPNSSLIRDPEGNLYGTTLYGGPADAGVVYKVDPAGHETVVHAFQFDSGGYYVSGGLILDPQGNLYGTASDGGAGYGVVYKLDPAGLETVLYSFTGGADGSEPNGPLLRDSAGNLYGTTQSGGTGVGGAPGYGVLYKLDPSGQETILYSFSVWADGAYPSSGLIRDSAGNLYGTTSSGGASGYGVVYKLGVAGGETVLYSFSGGNDGGTPFGGLTLDAAGNLYGNASDGAAGYGVVYKVDQAGHETVLHTFTGGDDGGGPAGGLIRSSAGNIYGATYSGGPSQQGVVYKLDAAQHETVLCSFLSPADGGEPGAGVIRDSAGNLYGTTLYGGALDAGTVYKVDAGGHETVLYTFKGGADGANPLAGVIEDQAGNFYGTTELGGTGGGGTVYKLDPAGNETVLYNFSFYPNVGAFPEAGVTRDAEGNLYGTALLGGTGNSGIVFKLDAAGNETVLYNFTGGTDGGDPYSNVIRGADGGLYGTAYLGGAAGDGVVYRVNEAGVETVLYSFMGGTDGANPYAGVIPDTEGNLYGTTEIGGTGNWGVVYKLDTAGHETVLYNFTGGLDGGSPGAVIRDSAGNIYGTTGMGGAGNAGVVYRLDTAGNQTVLYAFTGGADGNTPIGGVIRDSTGNLYGTTEFGGKKSGGVVFRLQPQ
jgi:uncharacterized repeat protein (TIGR03803 family)